MAYDQKDQARTFVASPRQNAFVVNLLLFVAFLAVVVIILLMIFWIPYHWHIGSRTGGTGVGTGGGIIVNAACCGGTRTKCPECPSCTPPPTTNTCEDSCRMRYGSNKDAYALCLRFDCNTGDPCETSCWKRSQGSKTVYDSCVQRECTPQTCEDICQERYSTDKNAYALCLRLDCNTGDPCETACWKKSKGSATVFEACVQRDCTPIDCRDSDGSNIFTAGKVQYGDELLRDYCYDEMRVVEYTCENGRPKENRMTCPERCLNGACVKGETPTTPTTYNPESGSPTSTSACRDTDKGRDAQNRGTLTLTTYYSDGRQTSDTYTDSCADAKSVLEYFCQGSQMTSEKISCPYGCDDGQCKTSTNPPAPSTFTPIIIEPKLAVSPTSLRTVSLPG